MIEARGQICNTLPVLGNEYDALFACQGTELYSVQMFLKCFADDSTAPNHADIWRSWYEIHQSNTAFPTPWWQELDITLVLCKWKCLERVTWISCSPCWRHGRIALVPRPQTAISEWKICDWMQIILPISNTNVLCAINPHAPEAERCSYKSCSHCKNLMMWMVCCTSNYEMNNTRLMLRQLTSYRLINEARLTGTCQEYSPRDSTRSNDCHWTLGQTRDSTGSNGCHWTLEQTAEWQMIDRMHLNQTWNCRNRPGHMFQATMNELQNSIALTNRDWRILEKWC